MKDLFSFPRPSWDFWLNRASERYGNLPLEDLNEAAEFLMNEANAGLSEMLS